MASKSPLMLLLLCVMAVAVSAKVHSAGGGSGWNRGVDLAPMTINRGDTVQFTYRNGEHNVFQVSQNDYYKCYTGSPIQSYYSGADSVTLYTPGTYYYICGVYGHCSDKMKLVVYVQ